MQQIRHTSPWLLRGASGLLCGLLLCLCPLLLHSQNSPDQQAQVDSLLARSKRYQRTDLHLAMRTIDSALTLPGVAVQPLQMANIWTRKGSILYRQANYRGSLDAYRKAEEGFRDSGNRKNMGYAIRNQGLVFQAIGDLDNALEYMLRARAILEEEGATKLLARTISNLGAIYGSTGDLPKALKHFTQGYKLLLKHGEPVDAARELHNISIIDSKMGNFEGSREKSMEAMRIYQEHGLAYEISLSLNGLGTMYYRHQNLDSAEYYFQKAVEVGRKQGHLPVVEDALGNLASIALSYNRSEEALGYLEESIDMSHKSGDSVSLGMNLLRKGHVYKQKNEYEEALQYLEQSLAIFRRVGDWDGLKDINLALSQTHEEKGDLANAYQYYKEYARYRDSLYNQRSLQELSNLRVQIETMEDQHEIETLREQQDRDRQVRGYMILAICALALAAIAWIVHLRSQHRKKKKLFETAEALNRVRLQKSELEREKLQGDVSWKEKELSNHTLNLIQTNSLLSEIEESLVHGMQEPEDPRSWQRVLNLVRSRKRREKDWENFRKYFGSTHQEFFGKIKKQHPELSANELRLCALVHLNLNMREMAEILAISPDSVKVARYRLKKKLALPGEMRLEDYVAQVT